MEIQFYGVRGSIPTPMLPSEYQEKAWEILRLTQREVLSNPSVSEAEIFSKLPPYLTNVIGGNTTCLSVRSKSDNQFIFDMGTGIRVLGNELAGRAFSGKEILRLNVFMTHTHWDHIQGWPFFKPAYSPNCDFHFYSCIANLEERLNRQQCMENFPITLSMMGSKKTFHRLAEYRETQVQDLFITPFALKHPGSSIGYRISDGKNAILFATDVEFREEEPQLLDHLKERIGPASVLIVDAQYSQEEADKKIGWGHTSVKMAVKAAESLGVETVILTHFEPDHTDRAIQEIIQTDLSGYHPRVQVKLAKEGQSFSLE